MTSKVGGRLALMVAAGFVAYFADPSQAAMTSAAADARAAETGWLGDTLSPSDVINLRPLAAGRGAPAAQTRPVAVAQGQVVPSDQLNDVDRALSGTAPSASSPFPPVTRSQVRVAPIIVPSSSEAWDQTSLIGKIFVGIGACLTLASAARMFMA